ncbi:hypothetical protein MKQ70_32410 [Chitinophaga sedimenti]|uniref:hypothetical protein n=1 Tax=Chitinophaga sedimenti TaxID=2033606 RepID=UPI002003D8AE|nr:hypothetical protein [Chitinophaga sedimenti]MCK7559421.1 hypothetical protein [Chitinophaga sedimenti]
MTTLLMQRPENINPNSYAASFVGAKLDESFVAGKNVDTPYVFVRHHYPTPMDAVAKLLLTPSAYFDQLAGYQQDLPVHYYRAFMGYSSPTSQLATITLAPMEDALSKAQAGRFLHFLEGVDKFEKHTGFLVRQLESNWEGETTLKLDYWRETSQSNLKPTPAFNAILNGFEAEYERVKQAYRYYALVRSRPNPDQIFNSQNAVVADNIDYQYSKTPLFPFLYLLNLRTELVDPDIVAKVGADHHYSELKVMNSMGECLLDISLDKQGQKFGLPGVYLGWHKNLMDNPDLANLRMDVLAQGAAVHRQPIGDMLYSQIGAYIDSGLQVTPGVLKFFDEVSYLTYREQTKLRPEIKFAAIDRVNPEHPYVATVIWIPAEGAASDHEKYLWSAVSFNDPVSALKAMEAVPMQAYTRLDAPNQDVGWRVYSVNITTQNPQQVLIGRYKENAHDPTPSYHYEVHELDERLKTAWYAMITAKKPFDQQINPSHPKDQRANKPHTRAPERTVGKVNLLPNKEILLKQYPPPAHLFIYHYRV